MAFTAVDKLPKPVYRSEQHELWCTGPVIWRVRAHKAPQWCGRLAKGGGALSAFADGVLSDAVSRDPRAESWLVFVDFASGANVQNWLQQIATPAVTTLTSSKTPNGQVAVCTTGFGATLFAKAKQEANAPDGLSAPAFPSGVPAEPHDIVFYIFSTSDSQVAPFLRAINSDPQAKISTIERGYQRAGGREVFGQRDGLRNVVPVADRPLVAFLGDNQPDEPQWALGGAYMAYLKIVQNLTAWNTLDADGQAAVIGRRPDGSRLDLPPGEDPSSEGPFAVGSTTPSATSHIRKAGPRGANEDPVRILRRGTPFIECDGGNLTEGLQFVSYQSSVDDFTTIFQRWMLNQAFPIANTGLDTLFDPTKNLTTIVKGGVYFAVPHDDRFIGAGLFDPPSGNNVGVVVVRVTLNDSAGIPDMTGSLEGAVINVTDASGAVLASGSTNAAGRVTITGLPVGQPLTITEATLPPGTQVSGNASQQITLDRCERTVITFTNTHITSVYGS
jgi:Dyp-type peroxidase family